MTRLHPTPHHPATRCPYPTLVRPARIDQGWVMVGDRPIHSPSQLVYLRRARIAVDGRSVIAERPLYLMLNKPRGLVTTRRDPQERGTVYDCLPPDLPFLSPVGRLDKIGRAHV